MRRTTKRTVSYTKDELHAEWPDLAIAFDGILAANKKKYHVHNVEYCGKHLKANGDVRRTTLGTIIDVCRDNGYTIEILVSKN